MGLNEKNSIRLAKESAANVSRKKAEMILAKMNLNPAEIDYAKNDIHFFQNLIKYLNVRAKLNEWLTILSEEGIVFAKNWIGKADQSDYEVYFPARSQGLSWFLTTIFILLIITVLAQIYLAIAGESRLTLLQGAKNLYHWILPCLVFIGIGWIADSVLEDRKEQQNAVKLFLNKLHRRIEKTKLFKQQLNMVDLVLRFKTKIFGKKIISLRFIIISLLMSQYLTTFATVLGRLVFPHARMLNEWEKIEYFFILFVPFIPYIGGSFFITENATLAVEVLGLFWNNYLFDTLTLLITIKLLNIIYRKQNWFFLFALLDIYLSYIFASLCFVIYKVAPPNSGFVYTSNMSFSNLIFFGYITVIFESSPGLLFYSLTTFILVLLYMSMFIFLSISKIMQWAIAPKIEKLANIEYCFLKTTCTFSILFLLFISTIYCFFNSTSEQKDNVIVIVYSFGDKYKYVGEIKNGKRHGQGTEISAAGDKYVGEFKDNKVHGQGTYTWATGDKYVGEFKNGKAHGQGKRYKKDGKIILDGKWKNGVYIGK